MSLLSRLDILAFSHSRRSVTWRSCSEALNGYVWPVQRTPYPEAVFARVSMQWIGFWHNCSRTLIRYFLFAFIHPVASGQRVKVDNPVVDLDGDEMTRIIWQEIKDKVLSNYRGTLFFFVFFFVLFCTMNTSPHQNESKHTRLDSKCKWTKR